MSLHNKAKQRIQAHSLIELLVVVGIIGILVSLIAPAATRVYSKAKAMKWENEGYPWKLERQLRPFYSQLKEFPEFSAVDLHKNGIIDAKSLQFLRSPYVKFHPFSSKMPNEMIVIQFGWTKEYQSKVTKGRLTTPIEE
ncbi:type II secretion system GspH family protein [bacterium]|jgi:type II secretory pathway pseudopilin PulG|nr:type II secretion system GspH family protein [bacterium]MDB4746377.1 type II secretion system GspH family protein [Verrucomicrobiota bacterium]